MFKGFDRHNILYTRYVAEISLWDWPRIISQAKKNPVEAEWRDDPPRGMAFLGTPIGIKPSGKIYALWTSNQTNADETKDNAWFEALEHVAEKHGGWIDGEEDFFFVIELDEEDVKSLGWKEARN